MRLQIEDNGLKLNGKDFYLASGDIHYFRTMPDGWESRLRLMKDFGLTAIQTYVPWHLHEPKRGEFDFSGRLNLAKFLETCQKVGLYVLLRPTPYITSESDLGGIPAWVVKNPETEIRCSDPYYFECISSYYKRLTKEFVPYLSTNGGPVIMVAIENEYGSFGADKKYLSFLRDELISNGVDVPFYTTDGASQLSLLGGSVEGGLSAVNCGIDNPAKAIDTLKKFQPNKPAMIGEFWTGRHLVWGGERTSSNIENCAKGYKEALETGAFVNFYMFCGGTNFEFTNGMHWGLPYHADRSEPFRFFSYATSYNSDALIDVLGNATPKYYALREVLDAYLGKPVRTYKCPENEAQSIGKVEIAPVASLFDIKKEIAEKTVSSVTPRSMESLDQEFGYILYSAEVPESFAGVEADFYVDGLHDMAMVYIDGKYCGSFLRSEGDREKWDGVIPVKIPNGGARIDVLVENMGRIDAGKFWRDRKGMTGARIGGIHIHNWEISTLSMKNFDKIPENVCDKKEGPMFYRGTFDATPGQDTFLITEGLTKGFAVVNGFNLGKYWNLGPQMNLYIPGELLKEKDNELLIFDIFDAKESIEITDNRYYKLDTENEFYARMDRML